QDRSSPGLAAFSEPRVEQTPTCVLEAPGRVELGARRGRTARRLVLAVWVSVPTPERTRLLVHRQRASHIEIRRTSRPSLSLGRLGTESRSCRRVPERVQLAAGD